MNLRGHPENCWLYILILENDEVEIAHVNKQGCTLTTILKDLKSIKVIHSFLQPRVTKCTAKKAK